MKSTMIQIIPAEEWCAEARPTISDRIREASGYMYSHEIVR
jgi:hypothetical protein